MRIYYLSIRFVINKKKKDITSHRVTVSFDNVLLSDRHLLIGKPPK